MGYSTVLSKTCDPLQVLLTYYVNVHSKRTQTLPSLCFRLRREFCSKKLRQRTIINNELQSSNAAKNYGYVNGPVQEVDASLQKEAPFPDKNAHQLHDFENKVEAIIDDSGCKGDIPPPKGGCGGGGGSGGENGDGVEDGNDDDNKEDEYGPVLSFEEVMEEVESCTVSLPNDMIQAAKSVGIEKILLQRYLEMQEYGWPLGTLIKTIPLLRNRMLVDPSFLFKVGTEIVIDTCCATIAEVQKRGKNFWSEFELYAADMFIGVVVNVALVGLLAPYARFGRASASEGLLGQIRCAYDALPSSVFEAERPGFQFSVQQRVGAYFFKGVLYGAVGFFCGLIGQGIANVIMTAKRSVKKSQEDIPVPPLFKSAALWGAFLAVSSNTRYQVLNGMERLVEASPAAKAVPTVAMAFTVGIRYANNVYGGMQFIDWARWSGCQ